MRTTLDINPEFLEKIQEITGESSKGRAVDRAMEEFIRRDAIKKVLAARGTFNLRSRSEWHNTDLKLELEHLKKRKYGNR